MASKDNLALGRLVGARVLIRGMSEDPRFSWLHRWKLRRAADLIQKTEELYADIRRKEQADGK
jgi:hypothetical protein